MGGEVDEGLVGGGWRELLDIGAELFAEREVVGDAGGRLGDPVTGRPGDREAVLDGVDGGRSATPSTCTRPTGV